VVGKPKLTEHAVVEEVAKKLGATTAQVLVAWGASRRSASSRTSSKLS
jgi:L-glyceraldehyde reductase